MNFESIVNRIESLPPLSDTALLVKELYKDGAQNVNIIKLVRAIESDALLAANILKMINSPLYGFSKKIASISQAVTLFGTQIVLGLVVRYSIESAVVANLRAYGISNSLFNDVCHMQSSLMSQWYSRVDLRHSQFLTPLALIMESGKLVISQELTSAGDIKAFSEGIKTSNDISHFEDSYFGTSSYYVSGLLFEYWNLEPLYVDMLKGLDFEHEVSSKMGVFIDTLDVVKTAVNIKDIFTPESIAEASRMVEDMELDTEHFENVARRIKSTYEKKNH